MVPAPSITANIYKAGALDIAGPINKAVFGGVIDWFQHSFIYTMPRYYWWGLLGLIALWIIWWFIKNFLL
jgi:hypothetical protein